ncbi:ArsR/SmtB family transcription factor [Clostridium amazonitimonense]|uniref:ArsR/SmtB family transcription factor n=1 Tax=Clostridium amazonitimonense TaxID=1499689 RepID=UPI000509F277|nr:metalloregulator ArsR/SmtB family transcription factor [Clostridium amazonitimonense]
MKVIYNKKPGEIRDYFLILSDITNYEYKTEELVKKHDYFDKEFKDFYEKNIDKFKLNEIELERYFKFYSKDKLNIAGFMIYEKELWAYDNIYEYLDFLEGLDEEKIKLTAIEEILYLMGEGDDEAKEDEMLKNTPLVLDNIKLLDIHSSIKWELFCFFQEPLAYFKKFLKFVKELIPLYEDFKNTRDNLMGDLHERMERDINNNEEAYEFIKKETRGIIDLSNFNEIYVSSNYFSSHSITFAMVDRKIHIFLGVYYKKALEILGGIREDKIQLNLMVFKNLSERNRFEIIRLLSEDNEYCHGDIAKLLNITGATVSYHINYLCAANLVTMHKKNKNVYYKLNKEVIKNSMEFLKEEFKLG